MGKIIASTYGRVPIGGIILWSGTLASIPAGWALCDGTNGTPNLIDRLLVGAGPTIPPGGAGGTLTPRLPLGTHATHATHASGGGHTHDAHGTTTNTTTATQSATTAGSSATTAHSHTIPAFTHASQGGHTHDAHGAHGAHDLPLWFVLAYIMRVS